MEARLVDLGLEVLAYSPLVWDVGAFEGRWSREILDRYPTADLHLFEPVPLYAAMLPKEGVWIHPYGLSDADGQATITVAGDRSSTYEMGYSGTSEGIVLRDILEELGDQTVHVLKLNVEGAEYPILERLTQANRLHQIHTLLIQFHTFIPNFGERYLAIKKAMLKTHTLTWRTPFVWERWDLRK